MCGAYSSAVCGAIRERTRFVTRQSVRSSTCRATRAAARDATCSTICGTTQDTTCGTIRRAARRAVSRCPSRTSHPALRCLEPAFFFARRGCVRISTTRRAPEGSQRTVSGPPLTCCFQCEFGQAEPEAVLSDVVDLGLDQRVVSGLHCGEPYEGIACRAG
jgi:hypothetical protein